MELLSRTRCPLCRSAHIFPFRKESFDPQNLGSDHFKITDSSYGQMWNFSRCRDCGFVFSNPTLTEADAVGFYSGLVDEEYQDESTGREKNFRTILKRLKSLGIPGSRLLDIGAASGIFLNLARAEGYRVEGIEPSEYLADEAKNRYGLSLFRGTLEDFIGTGTPAGQSYSLVTLLDLIEHVADPDALMARVASLLAPGGVLVIVTPDIGSLMARAAGRRWWHYRIAHLHFFNRKSLALLLNNHGLKIVKKKRYAWHFTPHYLLTRLFPALKNRPSLQKLLKPVHLKLQLFDSLEIYARKI